MVLNSPVAGSVEKMAIVISARWLGEKYFVWGWAWMSAVRKISFVWSGVAGLCVRAQWSSGEPWGGMDVWGGEGGFGMVRVGGDALQGVEVAGGDIAVKDIHTAAHFFDDIGNLAVGVKGQVAGSGACGGRYHCRGSLDCGHLSGRQ